MKCHLLLLIAAISVLPTTRAALILYTAEGDTTSATDQLTSDGSQNGTFVGAVSVNSDPAFGDKAYGFPTSNNGQWDVIDIANSANLGNAFTLAMQVKTTALLYQRLFSAYDGSGGLGTDELVIDLDIDNNTAGFGLRAIINGVPTFKTLPGSRGDEYHHYAVTYDNTGLVTLYYDGAFLISQNVGAASISLVRNLRLGEDHAGTNPDDVEFDGSMDDILVYDRAMTSTEISNLATLGAEAVLMPEPSTLVLFGLVGLAAVFAVRRRR